MRLHSDPEGTDARPTMAVLAWDKLNRRQKAEHLVYAHGFDVDWFWRPERPGQDPAINALDSNLDVVAWMVSTWTGEELDDFHSEDHQEYPHGGADRCQHTHGKCVR